jgi:hypothetical protein
MRRQMEEYQQQMHTWMIEMNDWMKSQALPPEKHREMQKMIQTQMEQVKQVHGRMARGGHGLLKVSPGLPMPEPFMPCGPYGRF